MHHCILCKEIYKTRSIFGIFWSYFIQLSIYVEYVITIYVQHVYQFVLYFTNLYISHVKDPFSNFICIIVSFYNSTYNIRSILICFEIICIELSTYVDCTMTIYIQIYSAIYLHGHVAIYFVQCQLVSISLLMCFYSWSKLVSIYNVSILVLLLWQFWFRESVNMSPSLCRCVFPNLNLHIILYTHVNFGSIVCSNFGFSESVNLSGVAVRPRKKSKHCCY